jgi:hypothetical protein
LARGHAVLHVRVGFEAGVEFGRDEGQEEVEEVDAEGVGDCFLEVEMLVFAIVQLIGLIRCRAMGGMPLLLLLLVPFLPFLSLAMYISTNGHAPTIASSPLLLLLLLLLFPPTQQKLFRKRKKSIQNLPIYHPCANTILNAKSRNSTPVPTHRYVTYGVDLSR